MSPLGRRPLPLVAVALAALTATACAASDPAEAPAAGTATITVEDARPTLALVEEDGESSLQEDREVPRGSVEVPLAPASVVTFDIATLDTLHTIGAGDAVVGLPDVTLPDYLSEYADLPTVGTLFEPDLEAVNELAPDLIITAARSTGRYDELAEIATTIDLTASYGGAFDPDAGIERAEQLGQVFEAEDAVATEVAAIEAATADLEARASGTALVLSVSGGEYGAFGEGSRFGWFFDELGLTPAVAAAQLPGEAGSPHGDTVTNEFILSADPDWILAFDRGAATGEGSTVETALDNEVVARTTAAQQDRIVLLPASELYIVTNGLTAIETVLAAVGDALPAG